LLLNFVRRATNPWFSNLYLLQKDLGLQRGGHPLFEGQHSPQMVLAMFSRVLAKPQSDWPQNSFITGFPFYDKRDETSVSPELLKFLDDGSPPIVFTLGSSAVFIAGEFFRESVKAAKHLGRRALLLIGDSRNALNETLPPGIAAFDYAPHSLVFSRAAAIVHQGGVGTTGQALLSDKPQLVIPFNHDQPDNAERVMRLGAGRTIARDHYKADLVAAELKQLIENPAYSAKAESVGKEVRSENGAGTAADLIEKKLGASRNRRAESLVTA
jgi:UDP:flavonoid glycosyltransferase YjiC (YdhE family)